MTDQTPTAETAPATPVILLAWLVPAVPLVWGVWQTLLKVAQLFN
ncbi:MFS transporter small subunit [Deinococcus kurensis]|nr:hypothetical protein [Deinococcus kurensis]